MSEAAIHPEKRTTRAKAALSLDAGRSDLSLLKRIANNDENAFVVLYARYHRLVYSICLGVIGSKEDAEEITQEVFTTAATSLGKASPDNVKAWLARVARNAAIDLQRSRARRVETTEMAEWHEPSGESISDSLERKSTIDSVIEGVKSLPEAQRSALMMRELNGSSLNEISQVLNSTPDGARDLIRRARIGLRHRREAESLECETVRDSLLAELDGADGRKRDTVMRHHLSLCDGCKEFQTQIRDEKRALRVFNPALAFSAFWGAGHLFSSAKAGGSAAKLSLAGKAAVATSATVVAVGGTAAVIVLSQDATKQSAPAATEVSKSIVPTQEKTTVTNSSKGKSKTKRPEAKVETSTPSATQSSVTQSASVAPPAKQQAAKVAPAPKKPTSSTPSAAREVVAPETPSSSSTPESSSGTSTPSAATPVTPGGSETSGSLVRTTAD